LGDVKTMDTDPDHEYDNDYVNEIYKEIGSALQSGMNELVKKRTFPTFFG